MSERPDYVPRRFEAAKDHYEGKQWKRYWDGFDLSDNHGFINCSECGQQLHVYSAARDDPGYNEMVGDGYVVYASQVAICGGCMYEAFDSMKEEVLNDE